MKGYKPEPFASSPDDLCLKKRYIVVGEMLLGWIPKKSPTPRLIFIKFYLYVEGHFRLDHRLLQVFFHQFLVKPQQKNTVYAPTFSTMKSKGQPLPAKQKNNQPGNHHQPENETNSKIKPNLKKRTSTYLTHNPFQTTKGIPTSKAILTD